MADQLAAMAAAWSIAGTGIATAWAQKVVGGATVGAMAEKPELFGRGLVLMALPETIVVFGLVLGLQLLSKVAGPRRDRHGPRKGGRGRPPSRAPRGRGAPPRGPRRGRAGSPGRAWRTRERAR